MTVKPVELTVTDNDVPNGRVRLVLAKGPGLQESDDGTTTGNDVTREASGYPEQLRSVGGTTFEDEHQHYGDQ